MPWMHLREMTTARTHRVSSFEACSRFSVVKYEIQRIQQGMRASDDGVDESNLVSVQCSVAEKPSSSHNTVDGTP